MMNTKKPQPTFLCNRCIHENVCKWRDKFKEEKDKLNVCKELSPVRISVSCDAFNDIGGR